MRCAHGRIQRRATKISIAIHALNRTLELGRPTFVRIRLNYRQGVGSVRSPTDPCNTVTSKA